MSSIRWGVYAATGAFVVSMLLGLLFGVGAFYMFARSILFACIFFGIGFGIKLMINSYFPELMSLGGNVDGSDSSNTTESADSSFNEMQETITIPENSGIYAVPEMYKIPGQSEALGNIEDLISGRFRAGHDSEVNGDKGVDRKPEDGYNDSEVSFFSSDHSGKNVQDDSSIEDLPMVHQPVFSPSFGESEGLGGLPDLDAMAMAFSSAVGGSAGSKEPEVSAGVNTFSAFVPSIEPIPAFGTSNNDMSGFGVAMSGETSGGSLKDKSYNTGNKPVQMEGNFNPKELAEGIRTALSKDK